MFDGGRGAVEFVKPVELAVVHGAGIAGRKAERGEDRSGYVDRISPFGAPCENALTNVSASVRMRLAAAQAAVRRYLRGAPACRHDGDDPERDGQVRNDGPLEARP